jgi:RND family efflux transporter MFP subunit
VVESIQVRPGDSVRRGDCLAALRLEEIDNQVKQAASQLDKTRRDLQRMSALFTKQVVTIEEKQNAETALEIAEAALRTARFNREYAVILAPDDGLILERWAEPGEITTAGRAILSFAANGNRWLFSAGLSEQSAGRLAIGDPATVTFRNGDRLSGRVARLAGATDPQTRLVKIEIELERPAREIRSGYLASALIQPQAVSPRPRVPLAALVEGKDRIAALFVVDNGKARRLRVEVEALSDQYAYLRIPLDPGTEIVVSGAERVADGIPLEVVPAAAVAQNVDGGRRSVGAGTRQNCRVPSMGETVTGSVP